MYLALCVLFAVGALAQVPTTCPGPSKFEGRFQRYDRDRGYQVRGFIAYDETEKRERAFEDVDMTGSKISLDILRLYEQNIQYSVDSVTKKCNISQLSGPFIPIGVPPGAKYVSEGVLGAAGTPGEAVTIVTFEGTYESNPYEVTVTFPGCFPINRGTKTDAGLDFLNFYDLTAGISDPELFIPPKECIVP